MNRRPFLKSMALSAPAILGTQLLGSKESIMSANKIIKPPRLREGDLITLIAPGGPVNEERVSKAEKNIQGLGFRTKRSKNLMAVKKHTAGSDAERLHDLHSAFADTETKAVWCVRGGDGCNRLLPLLDYDLIKRNPKALIGFSDITALLNAIFNKAGLVGFHGPIGAWSFPEYTEQNLKTMLMDGPATQVIHATERTSIIRRGSAEGQLAGGNLSLMAAMAGTEYDNDYIGKIVFIEDVGEAPRRIDRMLTQLSQSSNLKKAGGIIFGEFAGCYDSSLQRRLESELETDLIDLSRSEDYIISNDYLERVQDKLNNEVKNQNIRQQLDLDLKETIIDRFLTDLDIPVLYDFPFSHDSSKEFCTLPVGVEALLDADKMEVTILESAVM